MITEFSKLVMMRDMFETMYDKYTNEVNVIVGDQALSNGLTPDHIKFSPEFQKAKRMFDENFKGLRACNTLLSKNHKKEWRALSIKRRDERRKVN